jgi:hypothetical protein
MIRASALDRADDRTLPLRVLVHRHLLVKRFASLPLSDHMLMCISAISHPDVGGQSSPDLLVPSFPFPSLQLPFSLKSR